MTRRQRTCKRAVLFAFLLHLCTGNPGPLEAGSSRAGEAILDPGPGKSVLLSLKISQANNRKDRATLYKSVARQRKARPTVDRLPQAIR